MKQTLSLIALVAAMPAFADDTRQLDAHEHGVSALNMAIDGTTVALELHAPGADIVGFEYAAESDADLAAIDAAITALGAPLDLFVMPQAAACVVTAAQAALEGEEMHDDHDDHDDHDEDHVDEDHVDHDHDDHDHDHDDDHADEAGHTEFHAEYMLTCDNPDALTDITFAYFDAFPNAKEVEVQMITASGAQAFEVPRDAPVLNLGR
ncbi:zinc uptake protein ZrgA [Loktanella sp. Alg231-35]|uniref:zinc uptake protein ZrgA n=1 Tax=Loktanella sp. Alg231-35 TaxID=1922220 RepID=UPI000D5579C9|nr:DUF2796 domain-containing protein [Loktanella sp. Alg231-35]